MRDAREVRESCEDHMLGAYRQVMETQARTSGVDAATLGLGSVLAASVAFRTTGITQAREDSVVNLVADDGRVHA